MREIPYNREAALKYASTWAMRRNPAYLNFDGMGGDCTNFASQCIYAGCKVMNPTKTFGWYYYSANDRAPAWTGVEYLHKFLVTNKGVGPYAVEVDVSQAEPGDIVQLGTESGDFYHSPVIVGKTEDEIFVAAHTFDAYMRPLSSYIYDRSRFLHISGVRSW